MAWEASRRRSSGSSLADAPPIEQNVPAEVMEGELQDADTLYDEALTDRLEKVTLPVAAPSTAADQTIGELVEGLNAHAEKLNARLFTYLDYVGVARR